MELRHYQRSAVDKTLEWFADGKEKPLVVLPTGTGKSLVQATLCREIIEQWPFVRIICATHSKELVRQNHEEIMVIWPDCPSGVYSAGLKKRQKNAQVLFAGIQSVYDKAHEIGHADIIIVDEAHTISRKSDSMWGEFFSSYQLINPNVQIIGMTATPYRLDSGNLVPKTFSGISFEYPVIDAINEGYLCELVSAPTKTHLRTDGVGRRGNEFIQSELEKAVNVDALTAACCREIIEYGADRQSWLIFASGNDHAESIAAELLRYGISVGVITQRTNTTERDKLIAKHKAGEIRALVNNNILTTGYNNRRIDLIVSMRPTESEGLWVQICGRGMRLHPSKKNCLLLDFAKNIERHGPIDKISGTAKEESSGNGEAPQKQCPSCFDAVHAAAKLCPNCGHEFDVGGLNISAVASDGAILSTQIVPQDYSVFHVKYSKTIGKNGKPDSMMVIYTTPVGQIREWVFFNHAKGTRPRIKADKWAIERGKSPSDVGSVDEALMIDWPKPTTITAIKDGKYWQVKSCAMQ